MASDILNARDSYIELIRKELLGPGSEISIPDVDHELISTAPDKRYSIGILFPQGKKIKADSNDTDIPNDTQETETTDLIETDLDDPQLDNELIPDINGSTSRTPVTSEESEGSDDEDLGENLDEEIGLATQNMPSSVGMTFFVRGNSDRIRCHIAFATYRNAIATDCKIPFSPSNPETFMVPQQMNSIVTFDTESGYLSLNTGGLTRKTIREFKERDLLEQDSREFFDALYKLESQLHRGYIRIPHATNISIDFTSSDYIDANQNIDDTSAKVTALRRKVGQSVYSITIMLVNTSTSISDAKACLFQPELLITTKDNDFVFQEYAGLGDFNLLGDEEQSLELQYRNKRVYATGLGTATDWDIDQDGHGSLYNNLFPVVEVPNMDFGLPNNSDVKPCALSMKYLSDLEPSSPIEKLQHLRSIVAAYGHWIEGQRATISELPSKYHAIAAANMSGCQRALERMLSGLRTLETNNLAWNAFELANRAMFMQRAHLKVQETTSDHDRFPGDEELTSLLDSINYNDADTMPNDRYSWRPFQIAFLLMSIDSIVLDSSPDRELVDLIWFPTGGGKTEAYLGLTAFSIFYRRLMHSNVSDGTTVIMRYTLRLLAAQQFTRASTLICACEFIRHDCQQRRPKYKSYPLGTNPITIGLWIGSAHTPNKNAEAKRCLKGLTDARAGNLRNQKDFFNKFQVLKCPWCGTKLVKEVVDGHMVGQFGYRMRNNTHFEMFCPQESCFFNRIGRLPIQIVDEELYLAPPTLLFGTVDKFAMLPWKKDIGAFFGAGKSWRSPELIIQDELHLISGPLGTMVGLYETIIDTLCSAKGIKTKIVASTATIRRAKEQCSALYNRDVAQFPHPGLNAEDSFFAREAVINYESDTFGRKYIGLMPSGKTKAMMEIRAITALAQKINTMDIPDDIKDKFWTLTVYFNSLKDLGKCSTLVDDDIKDFIKRTAYRTGTARDARMIARADELTSRISTTELNETLDKLEKRTYSEENIQNKRYPSNILLATNMISVGIDVARLNVMLLVGQPKLTSEYIQASSRIGRTYPGVAFAMYDGSKSRDRSHYEQFKSYHESFYKHVEPTGATPFSKPARDRALHAVVIALTRQLEPALLDESNAALFSPTNYEARIADIKQIISQRSSEIVARMSTGMEDDCELIADEITEIFAQWGSLTTSFAPDKFSYGEKYLIRYPEDGYGRLLKPYNTSPNDIRPFETMTSMRNVDATVAGNVLIEED